MQKKINPINDKIKLKRNSCPFCFIYGKYLIIILGRLKWEKVEKISEYAIKIWINPRYSGFSLNIKGYKITVFTAPIIIPK